MRRFIRYDHLGTIIGEVDENKIISLVRNEKINAEHSLQITTVQVLEKGERIVYEDGRGIWREYVVAGVDEEHASGNKPIGTYYCVWSIQSDLYGVPVSVMPGTQTPVTAGTALASLLSTQSRWERGTVTHTATGGASMYDTTAWAAIGVLVKEWGGELDTTIEVSKTGVITRLVDLYTMQGDQTAKRRFDFGADLSSINRKYADTPFYCRISPRGKGEETASGGYGRKITIESVNGGKDYLEYASMVDIAKIPDGDDGYIYPTLIIENGDIERPSDLLAWAQSVLEYYCSPKITYEVDVIQAAIEGVDIQGVSLGDAVQIVDRKFGDGLRISGRIIEMSVDELNERSVSVKIGDVSDSLASKFASFKSLAAIVASMNGGTTATYDYLNRLLERINGEINATGGYTYITEGQGIRTYDKAVSDPLIGAEADAVVEVKGGTLRIANSRTAQGDWDWKTVFTSGHVAANLVTAANITAGYIGSAGDTFIDLDNHTVQLGQTASGHAIVDASGMEIFDGGGNSAAKFNVINSVSMARVGMSSYGNVAIEGSSSATSISLLYGSSVLAKFGYGQTHYIVNEINEYDTYGTYVTIGTRKSETTKPGTTSFSVGISNSVQAQESSAIGRNNTVRRSRSIAIGNDNNIAYSSWSSTGSGHAIGDNLNVQGSYVAVGRSNASTQSAAEWAAFVVGGGDHSGASTDPWTGRYNAMVVDYTGDVTIGGTLTQLSDKRSKEHISYLDEDACEYIRALKPALFSMKAGGSRRTGFYAQDVQDAEPETWETDTVHEESLTDDESRYVLDYSALIAPLVAYAQQLEKRIEQLESKLSGDA